MYKNGTIRSQIPYRQEISFASQHSHMKNGSGTNSPIETEGSNLWDASTSILPDEGLYSLPVPHGVE